jgi:hypothetical protein
VEEQLQQINAKLDNILGIQLKIVALLLGTASYLTSADQAALAELLTQSGKLVQQVDAISTAPPKP